MANIPLDSIQHVHLAPIECSLRYGHPVLASYNAGQKNGHLRFQCRKAIFVAGQCFSCMFNKHSLVVKVMAIAPVWKIAFNRFSLMLVIQMKMRDS